MNRSLAWICSALLLAVACALPAVAAEPKLELKKGDKIVLIGNTLAERMQYYNHWETLLIAAFRNST